MYIYLCVDVYMNPMQINCSLPESRNLSFEYDSSIRGNGLMQ